MSDKPRMIPITDPKEIAAIVGAGKYRETLPFWSRAGDTLWVEKPVTQAETGAEHG